MAAAAAAAPPLHNVFVYGTLLADEVVRVLLKRVPPSSPAVLHDYHRFSIRGCVYPAILPVDSKNVTGEVLLGITDPELDVLDAFEDVEYERKAVEVSLVDKSEKLIVDAYIWGNEDDPNLYGDWNFKEWKRLHLEDYLAMTTQFMEELERTEDSVET